MLDIASVDGGALRGAGDGGGAGDHLPLADNTDLDSAAGRFAALRAVIMFCIPPVRLRPINFADGIWGTLGAILLPAGLDNILAAADHAVIDVAYVAGIAG